MDILHTVVTSGTGKRAQVGDDFIWGKTGTTDDNADAWFVGANEDVTVAVWVGYADGATPMQTEFGGLPVDGGTIPALIFHDVVTAWDELAASRAAAKEADKEGDGRRRRPRPRPPSTPVPVAPETPAPVEPEPAAPAEPTPPAGAPPGSRGSGGAVERRRHPAAG